MTRILTALFLLLILNASGRTVHIDTLIIPKGQRFSQDGGTKLRFPIIRTGDKNIDAYINNGIKDKFTNNEFPALSTDSALIMWADQQIVFLDFEVTYLKNDLISLNISVEGCGANCTGWTEYYTYSTNSGKYMTIDEIIDTTGMFRLQVLSDKRTQYDSQRKELKKMMQDKNSELDEDTYAWALEEYDQCDSSFDLKTFALYPDRLEIIAHCFLPNAIKNLTPMIKLSYKFEDIAEFLKIEN
jgi:hypothetical protein